MSGRRRRASTSSVETIDGDKIRWLQESSVVRSQPKDVSKDDYPCFELRDATVYDRKGEALENALNVVVRGPYIVRGHLIIDDPSQKTHLIMRVKASTPIEIRHCIAYSIGEDDGRPVVWVLGRGGWYEINPSDAYRPIFNKMCEATTMYYSLVDIYSSGKFSKTPAASGPNLLEALRTDLLQYAMKVGDGATFNEVIQRCAEHAIFFVCQFGQESLSLIDWKQTPFHKWFTVEHADVVHKTELALKNPRKPSSPAREIVSPAPSNRSSNRITRSLSTEAVDPDQIQLSKRPKPSPLADVATPSAAAQRPAMPTQPADGAMSTAADDDSPLASVLAALEALYAEKGGSKKGLTATNSLNFIYFNYRIPNYKDGSVGAHRIPAEEVLHYNAAALLQVLDKERFQKHELWSFLEELSTKPFSARAIKASEFPFRLIPRKAMPRQSKKPAPTAPTAVDPESSSHEAGAASPNDAPRHIGKSLKRPGRRPIKTSGLRTGTASKKRTHAEIGDESEPDSEASGIKRSHYFSDKEEEEEEGDTSMQDLAELNTPRKAGPSVQSQSDDVEPIQIVIRTEKIPSTVPKGPDDTWTCEEDGCAYVVRGGDAQGCQTRIQKHFEEHQEQNKRLNLAVTESSRGHMPIKYAYFPPFLILVEFPPTTNTSTIRTTPAVDAPLSPPPEAIPDLSGSATDAFRQLVAQFRRRPQPVSDRIPSLTLLQSSTREAQANGRKSPAEPVAGWNTSAADQEETDSVTLQLEDDD
ncbi:hypothetical protein Trihar35433_4490 [Trichoderma harzianum]|nr:hypothetical protein Trihar35433_4490 [Trichoderma harzianum]